MVLIHAQVFQVCQLHGALITYRSFAFYSSGFQYPYPHYNGTAVCNYTRTYETTTFSQVALHASRSPHCSANAPPRKWRSRPDIRCTHMHGRQAYTDPPLYLLPMHSSVCTFRQQRHEGLQDYERTTSWDSLDMQPRALMRCFLPKSKACTTIIDYYGGQCLLLYKSIVPIVMPSLPIVMPRPRWKTAGCC